MYVLGFFLALFLVFNLPKTTYAKAYVYKPDDTQPYYILDRGFTGHQHLDAFNLVDMKGRVYDCSCRQLVKRAKRVIILILIL